MMKPVITGMLISILAFQAGHAAFAVAPDSAVIAKGAVDDMIKPKDEPEIGIKYMQPSKSGARPQPSKIKLPSEPTDPGKSENPRNPKDDPANQLNETSRPQ